MKDFYKELATIQAKRKVLEAKENEIKVAILADMEKSGECTKINTYGKFTVASRLSYTYSDAVKALVEKVKMAKLKEEQKGTAKSKETKFLVFTSKK